ncbi:MAG: hypothetical protein KDD34_00125 [Bdellovibrionales bacterium]|nr:hypothetical protein [Bdellovibrionales bacterium]
MKRQYLILALTLSSTLMLFSNCSSKSGSSTSASRSVPVDDTSTGSSTNGKLSNCNVIGTNSMSLAGPVSTFYDPNTQQYVEDLIRVKFNGYPVEIISSATHYIQFFRWHEDTPGSPVYNTTAVDIYFLKKGSGQWLQTQPVKQLSKGTIQALIEDNGLDSQGITPNNFFSSVIMVLDGMDLTWDAMTVALYDSSQGTSAIDHINVLLPAFDADPNIYATGHAALSLRQLHPFWSMKDSNLTEDQYWSAAQNLCLGF